MSIGENKILEIKTYPQKILRGECQSVIEITDKERQLLENMLLTMKHSSGIGLAAPQVGIKQALIVADVGEGAIKLANPKIVKIKGSDKMEEGCLSVPNALVNISRPYEVIVEGLNEQGKTVEIEAKGLLARVLLHEIDHLNGKLIIDYMNFLQKLKYKYNRRLEGLSPIKQFSCAKSLNQKGKGGKW